MKNCDRCRKPTLSYTMSRFNTEEICGDCEGREIAHPKYQEAHDKELAEVRAGNMNYPGIGCPADLYLPPASAHIDLHQEWSLLCSEKGLDAKSQVELFESFLQENGLMGRFVEYVRGGNDA